MGLVLQLVETQTDGRMRSVDVLEISRPKGAARTWGRRPAYAGLIVLADA